jgi:hypothetical protein
MRLTILIFLLSCSQLPSSGEKFGKSVPERVVYGFYGEGVILLEEPGTEKKTDIILRRGEKAVVTFEAKRGPSGKDYPRPYKYITTDLGSGWIKRDSLCIPAETRTSRNRPKKWSDDNWHHCPIRRTLTKDRDFFSGKFETNTDKLTVSYHQGNVIYELELKDPRCTKVERGRLKIKGNSAHSRHLTMDFADDYVDIKFGVNSDCPGFSKDFYHLLKGKKITFKSSSQSGCDLDVTGIDRKTLLSNFYALKSSVKYDDAISLSNIVNYPIFTKIASKVVEIKNPHHFQKLYPRIKNDCFKNYVSSLRLTDVFCNYRGLMWGSGEIWMSEKFHHVKFDNMCIKNEEDYWN